MKKIRSKITTYLDYERESFDDKDFVIKVTKLVKNTPNDLELGTKIRNFVSKFKK
jgi:hypothetical protein